MIKDLKLEIFVNIFVIQYIKIYGIEVRWYAITILNIIRMMDEM